MSAHPTAIPHVGKSPNPSKQYPEYSLFPHATRRWAKKIRGQLHYFGPWEDTDAALQKYLDQKDALHAGRRTREVSTGVTVKELCNQFLNAKQALVDSGELANHSWKDYKAGCDLLITRFGKGRLVADPKAASHTRSSPNDSVPTPCATSSSANSTASDSATTPSRKPPSTSSSAPPMG